MTTLQRSHLVFHAIPHQEGMAVMRKLILLAVIGLLCAPSFGQASIFDDNWKPKDGKEPPPLPKYQSSERPSKPKPEALKPADPSSVIPETRPIPDTEKPKIPDADDSGAVATKKRRHAEDIVDEALKASTEYVEAEKRVDATDKSLRAARDSGVPEDKAAASSAHIAAISELSRVRESVLRKNKLANDANEFLLSIKKSGRNPGDKNPEDRPKEIIDAVGRHELMEGMTISEACRAARLPVQMVWENDNERVYRWTIKGRTGTYTTTKLQVDRQYHTETFSTYGVIGYVEAKFVDGYLVSAQRYAK